MAKEKLFHVGVKALLRNMEGKLLVLKTIPMQGAEPHWDIPGGRIKQGSNALDTMRREVTEETGITELGKASFLTAVISNIEVPVADLEKSAYC